MAESPRIYTRLTRAIAGLGSYQSLWTAADHLLIVRSTGYTEEYARLHFRDLQGFFVINSDRRLWWGFFWGVWLLIGALPFTAALVNHERPIFSVLFLILGVGGMIWNHWLGRGCRAFVVTGVQTASLPSVVRWRRARRLIARLEPIIREAQVDLVSIPPAMPAPTSIPPSVVKPPPLL